VLAAMLAHAPSILENWNWARGMNPA